MAGISSKAITRAVDNKYKYNGKEEQRREFADGSGLDWISFGERHYDAQVARWYSLDLLSEKYSDLSPLSYCGGNPIKNIDIKGKYIVSVHYAVTYWMLSKAGLDGGHSDLIAHYSSVYADHPSSAIIFANNATSYGQMFPQAYRRGIDYSNTSMSQKRSWEAGSTNYNFNIWHSMMSQEEHELGSISKPEAKERGMEFGWNMVFGSAEEASRKHEKLGELSVNTMEIQMFGQGVHALQDATIHQGRHDVGLDHLNKDLLPTKDAFQVTISAIATFALLTNDSKTLTNVFKDGKATFVTEGMSSDQVRKVVQAATSFIKNSN